MLDALHLSALELCLCGAAAVAGAAIQGAIGFGYALVVVPTLLLLAPSTVPVTPLVVATPMVAFQSIAERRGLDLGGFGRMTAGRVPGTAIGAWVLSQVSAAFVAGAAGALLLTAVAASAVRGRRSTSKRLEVVAGFFSGIAGTVGAVGGPYLGLAYADRPGHVLRATVSLAFLVGLFVSLTAIGIAGEIAKAPVQLGFALVPTTLIGLFIGRRIAARLDGGWLRPAVLVFAGAAGLFALLRAVI